MVPASITVLECMPLTANGKIDRKALPVPEQAAADLFEAPQGEAEQALAAVWADLFGLERAGRQDRKSTRLNSSHSQISYAVFCLKKKKKRRVYDRESATLNARYTTT